MINLESVKVRMIIDTGSSVNLIDKNTFNKLKAVNEHLKLKKSKTKIFPYASEPIKILGYFQGTFENKNHITTQRVFVVNKENAGNLLCLETAKDMNFINVKEKKIQINSLKMSKERTELDEKANYKQNLTSENASKEFNKAIQNLIKEFADIFEGRGTLKDYECKLHVDKNVTPVSQKHRRYPYHLRNKIKEELNRLEQEDVIERVKGPIDWTSNLVVVPKPNGSIRLCLDARTINTAIKRETYPIPTLESVLDDMHGAKVFTKIDLKEAYTQLMLDKESRKMTNFNTDEGVFRYKRLIYGIKNAFKIFQRAMEQSFGKMTGVKFISDDIIISALHELQLIERLRIVFMKIRELGTK